MGSFLITVVLLSFQQSPVNSKLTLQSYEISRDEKLITEFKTQMFNDSTGMTFVNGSGRLTSDFVIGIAQIELKGWLDERRTGTERLIFKGNVNICNFAKGVLGNFVSIIVHEYIEKNSNIRPQCPFPKGPYYLKPCPFDVEKYIPPFWIQKGFWELYITMKIKLTKSKPTQVLFNMRVYGTSQ